MVSCMVTLHDACLSLPRWTYEALKGIVGTPQEFWNGGDIKIDRDQLRVYLQN